MKHAQAKRAQRIRRHARIRASISGTAERPRLAVFRSNRRLVAQLIDDEKGATIASVSSDTIKGSSPRERAEGAGAAIAKAALDKKVTSVVFDRGGFQYVGAVKAFADSARAAGLAF